MKHARFLLLLGFLIPGCFYHSTRPEPPVYESDLTVPGNLLKNLVTAYNRREIDPYADLMAKDFNFRFAPGPEAEEHPQGLTRSQEVLFTGNMFQSDKVAEISLDMRWGEPSEAVWKEEPALVISLLDMDLQVAMEGCLIHRVRDHRQSFYFRQGKGDLGEDTARYYIVGWVDHGPSRSPAEIDVD